LKIRDFSHCQLLSKQCYIAGLSFKEDDHVYLLPIRRKSKSLSVYVERQYSQVASSRAIECCEQAFTSCMVLPLTTAQSDMNILHNCPVGHIPLGELNVKIAVIDWVLCFYHCLWAIMQFDIHQIIIKYIANINLPIMLAI